PSGKLVQIEYALAAVGAGAPSVGIKATNGVVLATEKKQKSVLYDEHSIHKIEQVTRGIGMVYSGMGPDFRVLTRRARKLASQYFLTYQEQIPVDQLVQKVANVMQEFTQSGGVRPFGVSLLLAGWNHDEGKPYLYQCDPSISVRVQSLLKLCSRSSFYCRCLKSINEIFALLCVFLSLISLPSTRRIRYWVSHLNTTPLTINIVRRLKKNLLCNGLVITLELFQVNRYSDNLELEDAVHTAILTLKESFEGQMTEDNIEIGIGDVNGFRRLSPSEIKDYLASVS
ncbi:proteasome subunit alpha type-2, partial [Biomphalaria glabrata]